MLTIIFDSALLRKLPFGPEAEGSNNEPTTTKLRRSS